MGANVKATVVRAGHDYMRDVAGDQGWQEMLARLTPEDYALVVNSDKMVQFPVRVDGLVFAAFAEVHCKGDLERIEAELRRGGALQADSMLRGVFSVFARLVSPQAAFGKAGSIITSIYTDVTHHTQQSSDGTGGIIRLRGLGESAYVSPWQCGWIERALFHFRAEKPNAVERTWRGGSVASDELVYDVHWG